MAGRAAPRAVALCLVGLALIGALLVPAQRPTYLLSRGGSAGESKGALARASDAARLGALVRLASQRLAEADRAAAAAGMDQTFGEDGTISGETAKRWRDETARRGGFPMPAGSFWDASTSDVLRPAHRPPGTKRTSFVDVPAWIAGRRGAPHTLADDDRRPVFGDGQWWPAEANQALPTATGWHLPDPDEDWAWNRGGGRSVAARYDDPSRSRYMDAQYERLVARPGGKLRAAGRNLAHLRAETSRAAERIEHIFEHPMPAAPARGWGAGGNGA
jgi:hypothetical protein